MRLGDRSFDFEDDGVGPLQVVVPTHLDRKHVPRAVDMKPDVTPTGNPKVLVPERRGIRFPSYGTPLQRFTNRAIGEGVVPPSVHELVQDFLLLPPIVLVVRVVAPKRPEIGFGSDDFPDGALDFVVLQVRKRLAGFLESVPGDEVEGGVDTFIGSLTFEKSFSALAGLG